MIFTAGSTVWSSLMEDLYFVMRSHSTIVGVTISIESMDDELELNAGNGVPRPGAELAFETDDAAGDAEVWAKVTAGLMPRMTASNA